MKHLYPIVRIFVKVTILKKFQLISVFGLGHLGFLNESWENMFFT